MRRVAVGDFSIVIELNTWEQFKDCQAVNLNQFPTYVSGAVQTNDRLDVTFITIRLKLSYVLHKLCHEPFTVTVKPLCFTFTGSLHTIHCATSCSIQASFNTSSLFSHTTAVECFITNGNFPRCHVNNACQIFRTITFDSLCVCSHSNKLVV